MIRLFSLALVLSSFQFAATAQISLSTREAKEFAKGSIALDSLKILVATGLDVDASYRGGKTLLHFAVLEQNRKLVHMLIAEDAKLNLQDKWLNTPLQNACWDDSQDDSIALWLLRAGADPNIEGRSGSTPLRSVIGVLGWGQNTLLFDSLIAYGADIHFSCAKCCDRSIFQYVSGYGTYEMLTKLIELGADVYHEDCKGKSALFDAVLGGNNAVSGGNAENLALLIELGVSCAPEHEKELWKGARKWGSEEIQRMVADLLGYEVDFGEI